MLRVWPQEDIHAAGVYTGGAIYPLPLPHFLAWIPLPSQLRQPLDCDCLGGSVPWTQAAGEGQAKDAT